MTKDKYEELSREYWCAFNAADQSKIMHALNVTMLVAEILMKDYEDGHNQAQGITQGTGQDDRS